MLRMEHETAPFGRVWQTEHGQGTVHTIHGGREGQSVPHGPDALAPKELRGPQGFSRRRGSSHCDASHAASGEDPDHEVMPSALQNLVDSLSRGLTG